MAPGYVGKILKINLNDLSSSVEEKGDYFYRTFMGGSAMASYFLLTEMEKGVDPLGPDNVLVLTTSVLTGAPLPGANRLSIAAKSFSLGSPLDNTGSRISALMFDIIPVNCSTIFPPQPNEPMIEANLVFGLRALVKNAA